MKKLKIVLVGCGNILAKYRTYWERGSISERAKSYIRENYLFDLSGAISLNQLSEAMYLGKLGEQVVLKSKNAFDKLQFMGYEAALQEEYYTKKMVRDKQARDEYRKTKSIAPDINEVYIIDIMRNGGER